MFSHRHIIKRRNKSRRTIVQLPDECLLDVFRHVSLNDLCSLHNTCIRFRGLSRSAFSERPESKEWHVIKTNSLLIEKTNSILQPFGDLMDVVRIQYFKGSEIIDQNEYRTIYQMLHKYCGQTLIGLGMDDIDVCLSPTAEVLFRKVKNLWFENVSRYDEKISNALRDCKQLVNLCVHHCHLDFSLYSFPLLESLDIVIYASQADQEYNSIDAFFRSHSDLKQLNISIEDLVNLYGDPVDIRFLQHLNCLEGLRIVCRNFRIKSFAPIGMFKNLQRFEFIGRNSMDTEMALQEFQSAETVEHLRLDSWCYNQNVMDAVATFHRLQKLYLDLRDEFEREVDVKQLLHNLLAMKLSLTELHLYHAIILDPDSIINLVMEMRQLKVLNFEESALALTKELYLDLTELCRVENRKILIHVYSYHSSKIGYLVSPHQYQADNGQFVKISMHQFKENAKK